MSQPLEARNDTMCPECHGDLRRGTHSPSCSTVATPLCRQCEEYRQLLKREKELCRSTVAMCDKRLEQVRKLAEFVAMIRDDWIGLVLQQVKVRAEKLLEEVGGYEK